MLSKNTSRIGGVPTQLVLEVAVLVVDRRVEAELIGKHLALLGTTGDPNDARALDLCDLADRRTDRAGGPGDQHGLARLQATHVEQPEIGGHAGNARERRGKRSAKSLYSGVSF